MITTSQEIPLPLSTSFRASLSPCCPFQQSWNQSQFANRFRLNIKTYRRAWLTGTKTGASGSSTFDAGSSNPAPEKTGSCVEAGMFVKSSPVEPPSPNPNTSPAIGAGVEVVPGTN
jgi:hypothetical protein